MIQALAPAAAFAEAIADVPESTMFSIEAESVAKATTDRRLEFATVRHCARRALEQIGAPPVPIPPDIDGVPQWPVGIVGSMTHCAGYRAAAVAGGGEVLGMGIDAEPHSALTEETREFVLTNEEHTQVGALIEADGCLHWDRIFFCAKEAVYKSLFPVTRTMLDFQELSVALSPEGTFRARILVGEHRLLPTQSSFAGRWTIDRGFVKAAAVVTS
jgi:4'-phosphopantetheinyl transferase EntD